MNQLVVKVNQIDIYPFILNFNSKHTQRAYMRDLQDFFGFLDSRNVFVNHPSELQLIHFIAYRDSLVQDANAKKTVARKIASIRSLMEWFLANGHISVNPAASLKIPRADVESPTNALTDDEVRAILAAPTDPLHILILHFLFMFGLRRSELVKIQLTDIYQVGNDLVLKVTGKGGKIREIPFNDRVKTVYDNYRTACPHAGPFLFHIPGRLMISSDMVYSIFKRYASQIGITRSVSPHSARATAITKALEQGAIMSEVADMAGHADIKVTNMYWKRRKGLKDSPVHKLDY